jgi:hypothetical protein
MNKSLVAMMTIATLSFGIPEIVGAKDNDQCEDHTLKGQYLFSASGYTRALPDPTWVPKAILELLDINGDGTLTTPSVTIANPFGNTGAIVDRVGNPGTYSVKDDCTGSLQFADGNAYRIYLAPDGHEFWMIQTAGVGGVLNVNVLQGIAKRVR